MAGKRKKSYRKRRQNRMSMFLVTLVVVMIIVVVSVGTKSLRATAEIQEDTIKTLNEQIQAEEKRREDNEELSKYTQTKKFVEEEAKEKLGLVYEDEIIFKEEE